MSPAVPTAAVSRRGFLGHAAGGLAATASLPAVTRGREATDDTIAFFVVGDTHFFADAAAPDRLLDRSAAVTGALVDRLNALPGEEIPERSGGGVVRKPFGVIHAGDVIDTGDKQGKLQDAMQRTEVAAFERVMGLTGADGGLAYPVYEVHGNHDGPAGRGPAIERIIERNKARPRVDHVSPNGLHYAWDVGDVRFVNLGIVVGSVPGIARRRRYAPLESLDFLVADLRDKVGDSGRPVVITHHVDIARYTAPVPADAPFADKEWDPADVGGFFAALRKFNVAAVFYGHTHARQVWRWDGQACRPAGESLAEEEAGDDESSSDETRELNVFNVDNSSHFAGPAQAVFYVELGPDGLVVREYATKDAWQTGFWSPLVWRRPTAAVAAS
jgi:predicted phosphodiesterase